jgi:hypothetical protein
MKSSAIAWALLTVVACAGPAAAENAFTDYLDGTANTFLTGVNGVVTTPADPVMGVVNPSDEYETVPLTPVLGRFLGMIQGTVLGVYRVSTGVLDMLFAPLPMVTLSPEPRYTVVPGFEYDG